MLELKTNIFEGKNRDEVLNEGLKKLNASTDEIYYSEKEEISGSLFKSKKYKFVIVLKEDLIEYIKSYLKELTNLMNINVEFETQKRENYIKVNMIADNNAVLIGKNGRTMSSIQTLLRQSIQSKSGIRVNVLLDTNEYKIKQQKNIERLAIKLAKDVRKSGVEVKMDSMNSFERRLVHNVLTDFKGITTISEGEEPNRRVVIKPLKESE